jgi:hypothetical protein
VLVPRSRARLTSLALVLLAACSGAEAATTLPPAPVVDEAPADVADAHEADGDAADADAADADAADADADDTPSAPPAMPASPADTVSRPA